MRPKITPGDPLTPRERQVADLIVEGCSNKQIATRLGITDHTAKYHVLSVALKMACKSRVTIAVKHARWMDAQ